jgi:recombination protein RecR
MARLEFPAPIRELVVLLRKLPGIGPRGAERIVIWLVQGAGAIHVSDLAAAIQRMRDKVRSCERCGFFAESERGCELCGDEGRNGSLLCVVEQATDVLALERTGSYRGSYHVLGGKLSPLDNVGPEDLRIKELLGRLEGVDEVVLALGSDVEGEATCHFLAGELVGRVGRVTRLAQGMPAGGGLEGVDELTLHRALDGRVNYL